MKRHVEIEAEIETFSYPRYSRDDQRYAAEPIHRNYSLVCIAGTNTWRINNGYRETGTTQWWFDGTNVYQKIISTGEAKTNASVHIRASQDGCPLGEPIVNLTWLAFCSGTYLKREGRLVPLPLAMLRHAPDGFAYSDVTETFQDELGLPRSTDLFASDALFAASVTNGVFLGKKDVELWKRGSTGFKWNFPERAHRFHYGVAESTNFLGWNLPVKFEWYQNEYENGGLIARSGGRGKVTSIRASEEPGSVILPGATNQNIVDWRFRDVSKGVDAIIYVATNTFASPTNDPELQRKFEARIKNGLTH